MDQFRPVDEGASRQQSDARDTSWQDGGSDEPGTADTLSWRMDRERKSYGIQVNGNHTLLSLVLPDGRQISVLRSQRTPEGLRETARGYVEVAAFPQLVARLREQHVILLAGGDGTGRRTTADMMLWQVAGIDRVAGIECAQSEATAAELAGKEDLLLPKYGTVLELPGKASVGAGTLRAFERLARERKAYVVLLVDQTDATGSALTPYAVAYEPPDPQYVLRRHLVRMLARRRRCTAGCAPCRGACRRAFVERCVAQPRVVEELAARPRPAQAVELAAALAEWSGVDSDLVAALGGLRRTRRDFAARLLGVGKSARPAEGEEDPQAAPRRQAFQIAYAAFDEHPLADVFDAAELLLGILQAVESGAERVSRVVFDGGIAQMLRLEAEGPLAATDLAEQPRRARLVDPFQLNAMLDAAWNDFDGARLPLLLWLEQLVFTRRDLVRERAARLAGWLATLDFDEVWHALVRRWAGDGRGTVRQAAASALDIAARDAQIAGRIQSRIRDWVRSNDAQLHDTAARAYGTRIGLLAPTDALRELRTLASRDDLNASASVARSLLVLYRPAEAYLSETPGDPEATWRTLLAWHDDDLHRLRVHAARGLTLLARRAGPSPWESWPLLLAGAADFIPDTEELARLWRAALTDPTTAYRAWNILYAWLRLADDDPELAERVVDLVSRVLVGPVAVRGRFHLTHRWKDSPTARRLAGMRWGAPPATRPMAEPDTGGNP
ncbi:MULTISPECIES: hypothetical protein [Micromonospora]|uniref:hypothetical protein n=2 Tax=unclassified Micromonospora TaxID=2617518 RepID=UPI000DEB61B7|nr:hypothetical protein [Micromonospora sp. LHW51205]RBQ05561.1 hypothetical protein DQE82_24850 [Micromonospora sp. LHW51205]